MKLKGGGTHAIEVNLAVIQWNQEVKATGRSARKRGLNLCQQSSRVHLCVLNQSRDGDLRRRHPAMHLRHL